MANADLQKVIVFIPALDEEEAIGRVIDKIHEHLPVSKTATSGYFVEILVVNDGSTDRTEEIARSKGTHIVSHPRNLGLGAATRTAMETAHEMGADAAIKIDADFQHDPEDIEHVLAPIIAGKTDLCWGSRFKGEIKYRMPLIRYFGNRFFTWLMNKFTAYEISDAQTGMMAFGKHYLRVFEIHGNYNPPQQLLIDANFKNMRYMEVPVVFHPRTTGKSFVNLKYPFYVLVNILRILIYGNPLKVFSSLGSILIAFSILYFILSIESRHHNWPISDVFIQNLSLITMMVGVQLVLFGFLADIIVRKRK